jgi:hypothetical protein
MAFTDAEKVSIRRHLGINSASKAWYPYITVFFAVDDVLETLPAASETECRSILTRLTGIETQLDAALGRLKASAVGTIKLNADETRQVRAELWRWRAELSNLLGVPLAHRPGAVTVV